MSYQPVTSNTLLTYALNTLPDPLQVSPASGNTVYAALTFVVSNNTNPATVVNVSKIQFAIPVGGTGAQSLASSAVGILGSASPSADWNFAVDQSTGICTATTTSGNPIPVTTNGIIFQVYNIAVVKETGTVAITVTETASTDSLPSQARLATFNVAKFPYGFFFTNFTPNVPMVQDQGTVTLTWEGSDQAGYTMFWNDQSQNVTNVRSWTSPALTTDTTFLLRAAVVSLGQTVTADLTTTVVVANPELQGSSLNVSGTSVLNGNTTIGSNSSTAVLVKGAANFSAPAVFAGATLNGTTTATNLTVNQNLTASGIVNMNNATLSGNLTAGSATVNGSLTAASLNVSGATTFGTIGASTVNTTNATVSGNMAVTGTAGIIGPNIQVLIGNLGSSVTYTANTDLMVTANISSSVSGQDKKSYGWATISTGGRSVNCSGGNVSGPGKKTYGTSGAATAFVRKGTQFTITASNDKDNDHTIWRDFYVWSLGNAGSLAALATEVATRQLSEEEIAQHEQQTGLSSPGLQIDVNQLAEQLLECFQKNDKTKLTGLLREMLRLNE